MSHDDACYYTPRTALIDGDIIAYRAAAWAHGNQGDLHDVVERVEAEAAEWQARAFCKKSIICLSCSRDDNFRRAEYPLYKAHRTGDPPAMLAEAKRAISKLAQTITIPHLEADDIMGILATGTKVVNPVIVTIDKDLRGVPGWHFNPDKEDFPVYLSNEQANYTFHMQWLTGDPTDGFLGIKGVGPAKAAKILADSVTCSYAACVLVAYEKAGYTLAETLAQARCARILRSSDFDQEARRAIPWTPDNIVNLSLIWQGEPVGQ